MGACCQPNDPNSKYIDRKMKENEMYEKSMNKLLFLGPGGSGKSTIFKQLQWLHGAGFNDGDIEELKQHITGQIITQMQAAITHYLCDPITHDTQLQNAINKVNEYDKTHDLTVEIADAISYIWQHDERLNGIFHKHPKKKILDETTEYLWNSVERVATENYIPSKKDIINIRNRTTGIIEKKITINNVNFHIFDVGGQRSERKKWIKCFADVKAVVFVVSLSCYNEMMFEDEDKNCMVDALELFDKTINDKTFEETPIILFLNKKDLFSIKIKELPINCCPAFEDYEGDVNDFEQATEYIIHKFEGHNQRTRSIYPHLTCAMDDENVEAVFLDVRRIMIENVNKHLNKIF